MKSRDLEPYITAIEEKICKFCPDTDERGLCLRDASHPCALMTHLEPIVDAVLSANNSIDLEDYVRSLRSHVCSVCTEENSGRCVLRELADCSLDSYVIPVIEVIEEVARAENPVR